jgi:hypothetical protein
MARYYLIARPYYSFHYEFKKSMKEALEIQITHNPPRLRASA